MKTAGRESVEGQTACFIRMVGTPSGITHFRYTESYIFVNAKFVDGGALGFALVWDYRGEGPNTFHLET